jgi:hypothetical protein
MAMIEQADGPKHRNKTNKSKPMVQMEVQSEKKEMSKRRFQSAHVGSAKQGC